MSCGGGGRGTCILGTAGVLGDDLLTDCGSAGTLVGYVGLLAVGGPPSAATNVGT